MILSIRTDKPEAELGLFKDTKKISYLTWHADRNLSSDIHKKIDELFKQEKINYPDLSGILFYKGPGSFTGLRIGASVANAISYGLDIPIAGANGEDWIVKSLKELKGNENQRSIVPFYGQEPKTTKPKK